MAYCGCGTKDNKIKWAIACFASLLGLVLIGASIGLAVAKVNKYTDCIQSYYDDGKISDATYSDQKDQAKWSDNNSDFGYTSNPYVQKCQDDYIKGYSAIAGLFWAGVACLVIGSIPCYVMCCCTPNPVTQAHAVAAPYVNVPQNHATASTPYQSSGQPAAYQPPTAPYSNYAQKV